MRLFIRNRVFLVLSTVLLLQGCASARKVRPSEGENRPSTPTQVQGGEPMGPPETYGPLVPPAPPSYGPEPVQVHPVVLVLGPGLARGFTYIGVFRALKDAKIPVGAILSTEMGSLVGTLYALSSSVNQFEWGLQKFKEDIFVEKGGFLLKSKEGPSEGKKFEAQLRQVFEKKDLSQAKIPIKVGIQSQDTGIVMVLDKGNTAQAVRAALAAPRIFTAGSWLDSRGEIKAVSAGATRPFLINEAKSLGIGPVIVVDVLSEAESAIALDELKTADLIIRPDVTGISYMDFQKKTDAAFRGKNAIIQHMTEIRRLVGLPENETDKRAYP